MWPLDRGFTHSHDYYTGHSRGLLSGISLKHAAIYFFLHTVKTTMGGTLEVLHTVMTTIQGTLEAYCRLMTNTCIFS